MSKVSAKGKRAAVPISYRLQLAAVVAFLLTIVTQAAFMLPSLMFVPNGSIGGALPMILIYNLLPIIIFTIVFITSSKYPQKLSRWFVAVIKTGIVLAVYGFLQSVRSLASMLAYNPGGMPSGPPPTWVTSMAFDYGLVAVSLAGVLAVIYLQSKKKKRRG